MMRDLEHLVNQLADDALPVPASPHPLRLSLVWLLAAAAYLALTLAIGGLRADLPQAFARPWFAAELVALVLVSGTTALSGAVLSFPDLHQKRLLAFAPLGAFLLLLLVILLSWQADRPAAPLPEHSYQCTACILLLALLPAAGAFYLMRQLASTHYRWAGSVAVLFAFSVGALWLRLHEANDSILHVVEWHYLPMLAVGFGGAWLGRRWLKW